jgi:2,4-dienoyl-CoA reductase-like NADH-dependent reductase (Old Yellow Enzyme family)
MGHLFEPLSFSRGPAMKNRFMLAPMTNQQCHADGTASDEEHRWLVMRAQGGFGATMTCGAHVEPAGQGFPGQLGVCSSAHSEGLERLASGIKQEDSLALLQLFHAGKRASPDLIGQAPLFPCYDPDTGARAMTTVEVDQLVEHFVTAAQRSERAGFDGVEIHGAHGYLPAAFLSTESNLRTDKYGGSFENRTRFIRDIVRGIRERCGSQFNIGVRLSAERFGIDLQEMAQLAQEFMRDGAIDYLDMSLWDVFKEPADERLGGRSLMSYFTELDRGSVRLGVAGKIMSAADAQACLDAGADFVLIGRAAILHHDFPALVRSDATFQSTALPVSPSYLEDEGLSPPFVEYIKGYFPGFVSEGRT